MNKIQIETKNIDDIKEYKNNPRNINLTAIERVAESIKEFGFKNPIVIDENDIIIAGHTRKKAAEELNLKTVPTIKVNNLSPEQITAYRIADNKTQELGGWEFAKLYKEMKEIENDIDLSLFGLDRPEDKYKDNNTFKNSDTVVYELVTTQEEYDQLNEIKRDLGETATIEEFIISALQEEMNI